jgi:hypothetical protein
MHSWILHGSSLCEVPIPANTPHLRSSTDVCCCLFWSPLFFFLNIFIQFLQNVKNSLQLPNEFISCIGLAMSPGNLVVAVV